MSSIWTLQACCEIQEIIFLAFYGAYVLIFFLLGKTSFLSSMRLLSVFIHEFGHASACWMTGGKVDGIEVYGNEGGVTKYRGGCRCLVIPAGRKASDRNRSILQCEQDTSALVSGELHLLY